MKNAKRGSGILLWVSVLLSIPVAAIALPPQYKPPSPPPASPPRPAPAPAYHPAPAPAERPAPAPSRPSYNPPPSRPSYNPPQPAPANNPAPSRPYSQPSGGSSGRESNPNPSAPVHTYTPGVYPSGSTSSPQSSPGGTTYTPHVYTPGSSATTHPSGNTSVSGEGVRISNGVTTYTPHASTGTSNTPAGSPATHANTYTPRDFSPTSASGGATHAVYSVPAASTAGTPGAGSSTLGAPGSQSVLHQVNTARAGLTGINKRSIPPGQVAVNADKSLTVTASNGRSYNLRPNGTLASYSAHGQTASFRSDGRLASLHTPTMDIARGPRGQRTVISQRPDHSRLVSTGAHRGYLERTVSYHGHDYLRRTYVSGGHSSTRAYSGYRYRGRIFYNYLPAYYYDPLFYGWAYYPWDRMAAYRWGWMGAAWFGCDSGYFDPADAYQSGAYWLTDYYLGETLEADFDAGAQAGCAAGGGDAAAGYDSQEDEETYAPADTPITPEIKQMIAEEVQRQLAYENAAAAKPDEAAEIDGLPQVLTAGHLFVASQALNVTTADGQQCALSAGDTIRLIATPPDDAVAADLIVVSSRKGDCPAGVLVSVPLESLQEMQNNFRAQLDSGLQALHAQQGQNGLPGAPYSAIAPPPRPSDEPPADNENVQSLLDAQQQQATQEETGVTQSAFASSPQGH